MARRQFMFGSALMSVLCLSSSPSFAQACDELKQDADETLVEFVEKEYDRRVADSGSKAITALRKEHKNKALLETQRSAIKAGYADKRQAAKQANNAYLRARAAWEEQCSD